MAKNSIPNWSQTASDNTDVGGIDISEGCPAANMNNMGREIMAQVAGYIGTPAAAYTSFGLSADAGKFGKQGSSIASASTTDLSAATGDYVTVTGTTTITSLGTASAGVFRRVVFAGSLTLTHNATSLILPGSANIVTTASDVADFVSEGSGNWRCVNFQRSVASPIKTWEFIGDYSGSSTVCPVIGLSAFRKIRVTGFVHPSASPVQIFLRTSTNNGSSYDSGASDYAFQTFGYQNTASGSSAGVASLYAIGTGDTGANNGVHFSIEMEDFNVAAYLKIMSRSSSVSSGNIRGDINNGYRVQATARSAFAILPASGTMTYKITVEGFRG